MTWGRFATRASGELTGVPEMLGVSISLSEGSDKHPRPWGVDKYHGDIGDGVLRGFGNDRIVSGQLGEVRLQMLIQGAKPVSGDCDPS